MPCAEAREKAGTSKPAERTELCMQVVVGTTAAAVTMGTKEVWIRSDKEEVRVFCWKYGHPERKLSV